MGPRSDNRGYALSNDQIQERIPQLQWVHGGITVVMREEFDKQQEDRKLQWVHGPITVVMVINGVAQTVKDMLQWVHGRITVVMPLLVRVVPDDYTLQWVHGRITVVILNQWTGEEVFVGASMGPRSDNRGYKITQLTTAELAEASMGPRSDNRGYSRGRD